MKMNALKLFCVALLSKTLLWSHRKYSEDITNNVSLQICPNNK